MDAKREVLTINVKKVIPWATGLALFITKEARTLDWTDKDHVMIILRLYYEIIVQSGQQLGFWPPGLKIDFKISQNGYEQILAV